MFEYLRGVYRGSASGSAVIECGGVGWSVIMPQGSIAELDTRAGSEALVYTHHVQREDAQELYGFLTQAERALFRKLMTVSGVGPKQSMRILSGAEAGLIISALARGDVAFLSGIPGLGAKTAQKLVFELKGKIDEFLHQIPAAVRKDTAVSAAQGGEAADCYAALQSLGYTPIESRYALQEALKEAQPGERAEELIKRALRHVK
ncbi:MAG: Holliday junction branch migration protein RuvA [Spirochaetota bacterium]|jgi:Holliday junction DNA helicase RuvA|nr:Holliday junction branch migration protein RuvA [Spirochaetota bacterium]